MPSTAHETLAPRVPYARTSGTLFSKRLLKCVRIVCLARIRVAMSMASPTVLCLRHRSESERTRQKLRASAGDAVKRVSHSIAHRARGS